MNNHCNLCDVQLDEPIYVSEHSRSLTSLCEVRASRTIVYFCDRCGHVQSPLQDQAVDYYESQYSMLSENAEEDQLYRLEGDRKIYRSEHEVQTLLAKLTLPHGARLLDFGCAKGATVRRLTESRSDLDVYLFDVSERYLPFWSEFSDPDHWAVSQPNKEWQGSFDAVVSYFVLEHLADIRSTFEQLHGWLKPNGTVYFTVPNVFANPADMIVVDHVNHFTRASLRYVLHQAGFVDVDIDDEAHESAYVVTARKAAPTRAGSGAAAEPNGPIRRQAEEIARFWEGTIQGIRQFEAQANGGGSPVIYGSGFYGALISTCLHQPDRVRCFVDANPYRQGKELFGKSVIAPESLDCQPQLVYVGLNPRIARSAMNVLRGGKWSDRRYEYYFL